MEYPLQLIEYYGNLDVNTLNYIKKQHIQPDALTIGLCADSSIVADTVKKLTTLEYYQGDQK
jgi:hypothetical protein